MKLLYPNAIWLSNTDIDNEECEVHFYENKKYKLYDYSSISKKEFQDSLSRSRGAINIEIMLSKAEYWIHEFNKCTIVYDIKIFDLTDKHDYMAAINMKWPIKEFLEYFKKRLLLL